MAYRSRSFGLSNIVSISACAITMVVVTFFSSTFSNTGTASPFDRPTTSFYASVDRYVSDALSVFDHVVVAPRPADIVAPDRQSIADVLFESHRQPGQDWRIAATAYRHIDPGRRIFA